MLRIREVCRSRHGRWSQCSRGYFPAFDIVKCNNTSRLVADGNNCCTHMYKSDQEVPRHWRNENDTDDTPNPSLRSKIELVWLSGTSWSWHYSHIPVPIPYYHPKLPRFIMIDLPPENGYSPWTLALYRTVCLLDFYCPFHQYFPALRMISTMTWDAFCKQPPLPISWGTPVTGLNKLARVPFFSLPPSVFNLWQQTLESRCQHNGDILAGLAPPGPTTPRPVPSL